MSGHGMQNAKVLISNYDAMLSVYLVVAVIYMLMNDLLNRLSDRLAVRLREKPVERSGL